ncbi:MAG TPA: hypothetical protein VHJ82_02550 [Actinomycetota bacterium]|nr:hypothetical protein [Actinomycetota bacterium]
MSFLRAENREWWLYIFVGAVLVALCIAIVYLEPVRTSSGQPMSSSSAVTGVQQAPWRIRIHPAGMTRRLSSKSKSLVQAQKGHVRALIRETYDALFLDRTRLADVVDRRFAPKAGSAFMRSKAGFPEEASRIKTTMRRARIGIQASNARHAAGQVVIAARARIDGSLVRIRHTSTLWLQRQSGGWRVVAFEIDQERGA